MFREDLRRGGEDTVIGQECEQRREWSVARSAHRTPVGWAPIGIAVRTRGHRARNGGRRVHRALRGPDSGLTVLSLSRGGRHTARAAFERYKRRQRGCLEEQPADRRGSQTPPK
jgi:hypothetical protein